MDLEVHRLCEQQLDRLPHDARQVPRDVDHGVPAAAPQRVELAVTVAEQPLDAGEQLGIRPAAVEERDLVPALERRLDGRATEELGPAEDQKSDSASSSRSTSASVL